MKNKNLLFRAFALVLTLACVATMLLACSPVEPEQPDDEIAQGLHVAMDLTEEWDKVAPAGSLVQGCLVIRKEFAEQHPNEVAVFLQEYEASVNYLLSNVSEASEIIAAQGIFAKAPIAQKAIPNCNVTYLDGAEMKAATAAYLEILKGINANAIGGAVPADDFYYNASK